MFSRWRDATLYMKLAFVSFLLGFILYVVGFSTLYWEYYQTTESSTKVIGLWKYLLEYRYSKQAQAARSFSSSAQIPKYVFNSGWFRLTQAVECLGLICMVIALLILLLYFFVSSCKQRKALYAIILFTFLSVLFIVIGIAVFGGKMEQMGYSVGWSMGLAIAGVVLAFLAGIMEVLELR
ncbi:uncharacterized protein LOC128178259 isoform X2 [Crassostrea angulata]|uniref:Uncharacterized protein n=2 Tax=Magallana gigas TaxID=29159 RepID=K1Q6F8_MAGGI|nr:uncharacterized protein LOC105318180 isoform X1 [Crassostrea gigas]XP_052701315.1 uncharacterized protein LOC128178259 isoform X2 [Crassostrea angulata]|eukprot:XP_011413430.1 PREDICTED: uncharacterized protein LOC105318180 isoform X2 [Crassostrea gigas]